MKGKTIKFLFLNLIYLVNSTSLLYKNEFEEGSGMVSESLNNPWTRVSKYEQNVFIMEEKIKSLSETFNQLELKINHLINTNMDLLEKNFRKIVDDKITEINQRAKEKIKLVSSSKPSYNVHELKCSSNSLPNSCYDLNESSSNIYSILVPEFSPKPFPVSCDFKTLNGGWTIIQSRQDGSVNFNRNWTDYVDGFGDLNGEFFIGLEKLYALTSLGEPQELYITLEDFEGAKRYAKYKVFKVASNSTDYKLTVGQYSGDASDCFSQHNGHKFSTPDRDNDIHSTRNCAEYWKGAWWYTICFYCNLNGLYLSGKLPSTKRGIAWCGFRKYEYSLKSVQMMIRPKRN